MKFSLRTLLVTALAISVACALLSSRSGFANAITDAVYKFSLLAALVAIIYRAGAERAFWIGYSIFGWGRLWLDFRAFGSYGLYLHTFLYGERPSGLVASDLYDYASVNFAGILIHLEAMVIALAGGCLAAWLYLRREQGRCEGADG